MVSIIITALIVMFCVIAIVAYTFFKLYKKAKKNYSTARDDLQCMQEEFSRLVEAYKIKSNNKEKANEEIAELHNGDVIANTLDKLRKHTEG